MRPRLYNCIFIFMCLLVSCDDDSESIPLRTIEIGNQTFEVYSSIIFDRGVNNLFFPNTHYEYFITISDRTLDPKPNGGHASFDLTLELYAPNKEVFENGEFLFVDFTDINKLMLDDEFILLNSGLTTDTNGDGQVNELDEYDDIVFGTVTSSGTAEDLRLEFDLVTRSGTRINTTFSGDFTVI